jgi:hypothetical protein
MMLLPPSRLPYTFAPLEPFAHQNDLTSTTIDPQSPSMENREHRYRSPLLEASQEPAPPPCIDPRNEGSFLSAASVGMKFSGVINCESNTRQPIMCDADCPLGSRVSECVSRCNAALKRKRAVPHCLPAGNGQVSACLPDSKICSKRPKCSPASPGSDLETQQPRRQGQSLGREAVQILKDWMFAPENVDNPYPTQDEKLRLSAQAGITQRQLCNWFVNSRKRLWAPAHQQRVTAMEKARTSPVHCNAPVGDRTTSGPQIDPTHRVSQALGCQLQVLGPHIKLLDQWQEQEISLSLPSSPSSVAISSIANRSCPIIQSSLCGGHAAQEERLQAACGLLALIPLFNAGVAQRQLAL